VALVVGVLVEDAALMTESATGDVGVLQAGKLVLGVCGAGVEALFD